MTTTTEAGSAAPGLYRLLAWASPAFPVGAFSYSHGLEAAVAAGAVHDRATLETWVTAIAIRGSGRIDADILVAAYRGSGDRGFAAANRLGLAYRATAELALESAQQGSAFASTCAAAWPHSARHTRRGEGPSESGDVCHAAAFAGAAARAGIALEDALLAYLHAFAGNLVSAGLRLGVVGQTDGQRILAALEQPVAAAVSVALGRDPDDFGGASFAADLMSMAHETQYSRLFRS